MTKASTEMKSRIRQWLNEEPKNYNDGKNVVSKPNPLYIASVRQLINEGRQVEIPVRGWSMRIFVEHERDKAILAPCDIDKLKRGDVVLADVGNLTYVLHRIIAINGSSLTLMGDGNVTGTEQCEKKDVVAIVTGFIRKGRTSPDLLSSKKWKIYSWWWVRLLPIRRYLLLAWRIKNRVTP